MGCLPMLYSHSGLSFTLFIIFFAVQELFPDLIRSHLFIFIFATCIDVSEVNS